MTTFDSAEPLVARIEQMVRNERQFARELVESTVAELENMLVAHGCDCGVCKHARITVELQRNIALD